MRLLTFFGLCGLLFFSACKEDSILGTKDALTSIPKDALMVTAVDIPQLMEKADFEAVKQMEFYQEMINEASAEDPSLGEVLRDPARSGIDLGKNMYVSYFADPQNPGDIFTAAVLSLADADAFEALVSNTGKSELVKGEGFKYFQPDRNAIIAWNSTTLVMGGSNGYQNVSEQAARILNTDATASVAGSKDLKKAMQGKHDISSWFSSNGLAENTQAQFYTGFAGIDADDLKDNFVHGFLDFENGRIAGESEYFLQRGLTKDLDKLFNDQVKTDFSDYVPGKDLAFILTNALNLKGIDEVLSARPQARGYLEFALREYDLKVEDILETFGGDILVAGYGADKEAGLFATNILDRNKLDQFLQLAQEYDVIEPLEGNMYKVKQIGLMGMNGGFKVRSSDGFARLLVKENMLFLSGNEVLLQQIDAGGFAKAERVNKDLLSMLNNHIFAGYFGFDAVRRYDKDLESLDLENVKITTTRKKSDFLLEMKNKEENALKEIFQMINRNYLKREGSKESI